MKKVLVGLLAIILTGLVGGAWYYLSPKLTVHQMTEAADAGDLDRLMTYVDVPLYSASHERLMDAILPFPSESEGGEPHGRHVEMEAESKRLHHEIGINESSPGQIQLAFQTPDPKDDKVHFRVTKSELIREGPDQFKLVSLDPSFGGEAFVFRRKDLSWKLSGVSLPVDR